MYTHIHMDGISGRISVSGAKGRAHAHAPLALPFLALALPCLCLALPCLAPPYLAVPCRTVLCHAVRSIASQN